MRLSRYVEGEPSRPDAAATGRRDVGTCGTGGDRRCHGQTKEKAGSVTSRAGPSGPRVLPRKEVIQPHVPVRLPCYDFTPLTLHTFGTSLPRGLGRRLRVQTTRVV